MGLVGVIDSFRTGTYEVTRAAGGTYVAGRLVPGAESTLSLDMSVQPIAPGRDLQALLEAEHATEARAAWCASELRTRQPGSAADVVMIDGEPWVVVSVERWQAFGGDGSGDHWRAVLARGATP